MTKRNLLTLITFFAFNALVAQSIEELQKDIEQVLAGKSATVGVALKGISPQDTLSINGDKHLPMQSVYKFHLALTVLDQVDQGKLNMNDTIVIDKERIEKYSHLWSPLRKKHPEGTKILLSEVIQYTVAWSDNLGCDLLFELVGGTHVAHSYMQKIGVKDIAILYPEIVMQDDWQIQYKNWSTALATNQVLQLFYENNDNLLSKQSYEFLLDVMKGTKTGKKRIRGFLPEDAVVAHKTGYSGVNDEGLTGAVNNIGIVFLPDNTYFYLSVLVSDSMEDTDTNQKIIADIAKLAWDYFNAKAGRP